MVYLSMRVGFGYDVHRFEKGRKFVLGGVMIRYHKGLKGHSDADVLIHSVCDALLGAAGLYDIGHYFPNTDKKWKDISSLIILEKCANLIKKKKLKVVNLDSTILLEEPRISGYINRMKKNIAGILKVSESRISIKSTTSEGLGFVGSKQGCSAYSICSLR